MEMFMGIYASIIKKAILRKQKQRSNERTTEQSSSLRKATKKCAAWTNNNTESVIRMKNCGHVIFQSPQTRRTTRHEQNQLFYLFIYFRPFFLKCHCMAKNEWIKSNQIKSIRNRMQDDEHLQSRTLTFFCSLLTNKNNNEWHYDGIYNENSNS